MRLFRVWGSGSAGRAVRSLGALVVVAAFAVAPPASAPIAANYPSTHTTPPPSLPPPVVPRPPPSLPPNVVTPPETGPAQTTPPPDTTPGRVVPNQVVVLHTDPQAAAAFRAQAIQGGYTVLEESTLPGLGTVMSVLAIPQGVTLEAAITTLRSQFPDAVVSPNTLYDPGTGNAFARSLINWQVRSERCGRNVRIGIVDSDVDMGAPSLRGRKVRNRSFVDSGARATNHGTAVAAVLVGTGLDGSVPGLFPAAEVYVAGVFERIGGRAQSQFARVVKALNWLILERLKVINMSLTGPFNLGMLFTLKIALRRGITIVAAAGNAGPGSPPLHPAAMPGVIAVTAIDAQRRPYVYNNQGSHIAFTAPGVNLPLPVPEQGGIRPQSGTSFAAPYVAGVAALWRQANPRAGPDMLLSDLASRAISLGGRGRHPVFGFGLIQAPQACG